MSDDDAKAYGCYVTSAPALAQIEAMLHAICPASPFALFSVFYRFISKEQEAIDPTLRCMGPTEPH